MRKNGSFSSKLTSVKANELQTDPFRNFVKNSMPTPFPMISERR